MAKALEQLRSERSEVSDKLNALLFEEDGKTARELSDEEREQADALEAQFDDFDGQVKLAETRDEEDRKRLERQQSRLSSIGAGTGRRTQPARPGVQPRVTREGFEDDPKRGFKSHSEFLLALMDCSQTGRVEDPRLRFLAAAGSDEQSTFADPYGGFLVPSEFSPNLLSVMPEDDPVAGRTTQIPMSSPTIEIPARVDKNHTNSVSGGLRVYRRAEGDTSPDSRMEMEQVTLRAHSLFGVAYSTEELLQRSPISFIALIEAGFRDEFSSKLLDERLHGSGTGMYEGVMTSPAKISVAKESGQAADTILKENIDKMRSRCWRYGQAIWLYNHDCLPQLRSLVQTVGTGGAPVAYFSTDANGNSTLDGRPAFATEFAKTIGDEGDLILVNWSQYLEGRLSPLQSAESMHVRFINHERTFKFWMENDGRCWWRSALTPKYSTVTLSPIVTLAARA